MNFREMKQRWQFPILLSCCCWVAQTLAVSSLSCLHIYKGCTYFLLRYRTDTDVQCLAPLGNPNNESAVSGNQTDGCLDHHPSAAACRQIAGTGVMDSWERQASVGISLSLCARHCRLQALLLVHASRQGCLNREARLKYPYLRHPHLSPQRPLLPSQRAPLQEVGRHIPSYPIMSCVVSYILLITFCRRPSAVALRTDSSLSSCKRRSRAACGGKWNESMLRQALLSYDMMLSTGGLLCCNSWPGSGPASSASSAVRGKSCRGSSPLSPLSHPCAGRRDDSCSIPGLGTHQFGQLVLQVRVVRLHSGIEAPGNAAGAMWYCDQARTPQAWPARISESLA